MALPTINLSREDGEKGEERFLLLHPGNVAAEIGRPVPLQRTWGFLPKLGGRSSLIRRKQGMGYRSAVLMVPAVLGVVE